MNYGEHYRALMLRARLRKSTGYTEKHHVVPRCMDATSSKTVRLTPEEHYVAHQLLVKMYPGNDSLAYAAFRMSNRGGNRSYGWVRRAHARAMSAKLKVSPIHLNSPASQKGRILSAESKARMAAAWVARRARGCSEETKAKQKAAWARRRAAGSASQTAEHRAKIGMAVRVAAILREAVR